MNKLINEFLDSHKKIITHNGQYKDECKLNISYDCDKCNMINQNKKGKFVFLSNTSKLYIDELTNDKAINRYKIEGFDRTEKNIKINIAENISVEKNILMFLKIFGEQKTQSIIKTIEDNSENKYFKITEKMKQCLAKNLLNLISFDEIKELFV